MTNCIVMAALDLFKEGIYPIVYSYIDGIEKFLIFLKMHRRNEGLP